MNWDKVRDTIHARVGSMSKGEQFRFFCSWYGGIAYVGGKENYVYGSDCSGVVCGPLYLMGYDIRCTANDLFREIFTDEVDGYEDREQIMAAFYVTREPTKHFGEMVPAGHITHVAPMVGRYVVMNAFDPIQPMAASYVYKWYDRNGKDTVWRQLNWEALEAHHKAGNLLWGLDPVLEGLR